MNPLTNRRTLLALSLASITGVAPAHTQDGSVGPSAASTDYYQVSCSDDGTGVPASLVAQAQNRGPTAASTVHVVVHRGVAATSTVDTTGGDVAMSPLVFVNGGEGVYDVFVSKVGDGVVNYTLSYHCMTGEAGSGLHTGTTIVFRQNQ
jgi:hypothetical protein